MGRGHKGLGMACYMYGILSDGGPSVWIDRDQWIAEDAADAVEILTWQPHSLYAHIIFYYTLELIGKRGKNTLLIIFKNLVASINM